MGGAPIAEGIRLYRSLAATGQVVLLFDAREREQLTDWLELNGLNKHAFVDFADGATRLYLANRLRRQGYDIDMIVEPDPWLAQEMIKAGYNTLLFTHGQYTQPSWRPDASKGVQAWAEITQQVASIAKMKAQDERLRAE
jgi:hypothetical protein